MNELVINYNGNNYNVTYNPSSGYYEIELQAPNQGGMYNVGVTFTDLFETEYNDTKSIRVLAEESIKIQSEKCFVWIFDGKDFTIKDIVEISDYEINIDEETNANSTIKILKDTEAKASDLVIIKRNNELVYWGTIDNINNENGKQACEYTLKYITNLFDRKIKLQNENIIRTTGIEDFLANTITSNFISNADTFINKTFLEVEATTHTPKETSVTNVEDGIYNLHTYMTNCTQNYDIVYSFSVVNKKLKIKIETKEINKEIIDIKAQSISDYNEVFETDVVAKVEVLYNKRNNQDQSGTYTLYLLNDRTTTTDGTNPNRADGKIETVFTEKYEDANQKALDTMKANRYNHNITFNLYDRIIEVGTPIAIKTNKSIIYDTYISAVKITKKRFTPHTCGNIRVNFIDKLLKERRN